MKFFPLLLGIGGSHPAGLRCRFPRDTQRLPAGLCAASAPPLPFPADLNWWTSKVQEINIETRNLTESRAYTLNTKPSRLTLKPGWEQSRRTYLKLRLE